ncbi:hypothetical protein ACRAWF_37790 [Streptomyces sp. L7]
MPDLGIDVSEIVARVEEVRSARGDVRRPQGRGVVVGSPYLQPGCQERPGESPSSTAVGPPRPRDGDVSLLPFFALDHPPRRHRRGGARRAAE